MRYIERLITRSIWEYLSSYSQWARRYQALVCILLLLNLPLPGCQGLVL